MSQPGSHGSRALYSICAPHYLSGLHGPVRREAPAFEGLKAQGVKYRAQAAGGSDVPCSRRAAVEPLPGQRLPPLVHTPTATFPRCTERSVRLPGGGTPSLSPSGRGTGPIRDLKKHNALELQLPPAASPAAAAKRPQARSCPARATVPLVTQVRRARPKPSPTSLSTCRTRSGKTCAHLVPGAHGPSPLLWAQLSPPSQPVPQPRPPPTFGFPARPEPPPRLGNHLKPRPRPTLPRPAPPRPEGPPASALRTRGLPGRVGPRRRPRVGRKTDAS